MERTTVSKELTDKMHDKLAAGFAKGDRIAELEDMVEACKADAREAEAYAEELEAKLAKAVEAFTRIDDLTCHNMPMTARDEQAVNREARTTLAALKGQDDE